MSFSSILLPTLPSLSLCSGLYADVINTLCTSNVNVVNQKREHEFFFHKNILFKIGQIKKRRKNVGTERKHCVLFSGRLLEVRKNNDCFTTKFETLTIKGKGM